MYKFEILCNESKSTKHQINSRVLKDFIVCLGIDFDDCRSQGYDGLNFSMPYVQLWPKNLKIILLLPQYIHCINICLQDVTRSFKCTKVTKFMFYFS